MWATVAISRPGYNPVRLLSQHEPMTVWLPERLMGVDLPRVSVHYFAKPLGEWIAEVFHDYRHWILVMPVSLATRLIAPLIRDKRTDPSVTVVDDAGRYAVCLLSCHWGRGNAVTRQVAQILQATPVITTATDSLGLPALEFIGHEWHWHLENPRMIAPISRMMLEQEKVGVIQESGSPDWRHRDAFSCIYDSWEHVPLSAFREIRGWLWITHRLTSLPKEIGQTPVLIYRPKVLSLGIGFSRCAREDDLDRLILRVLAENSLSAHSVDWIVTTSVKRNDQELEKWAAHRKWRIRYASASELNSIGSKSPSQFNPSVFEATGAYAVAEPAAILGAGGGSLLVPKCKSKCVTVAIALKQTDNLNSL